MHLFTEGFDKTHPYQAHYFLWLHKGVLVLSALFVVPFIYFKPQSDSTLGLAAIWLLVLLVPALTKALKLSYQASALLLSLFSVGLLLHVLMLDGGFQSHGVFWLAAIPLMMGILLGVSGVYVGFALTLLLATSLAALEGFGFTSHSPFFQTLAARFLNLTCFLAFTGFITRAFIVHHKGRLRSLKQKNSDIENLLRILVHDVANSLSGMTYNLMKAKEDSDPKALQLIELDRMEKAVDDISNLLSQVRHLKSFKDGKARLALRPLSLNVVLNEAYENSLLLAQKKGVRLAWEIAQDRMMIHGEKAIFSNVVLQNLLSNAIKFSFPGDSVVLRAFPYENRVMVEIQDFGIGIPVELQNQMFHVNKLTTRTGTQGEKGTGYGMPLVKEYLQMMKGEIDIISREQAEGVNPRGTRIVLSLPLAEFDLRSP